MELKTKFVPGETLTTTRYIPPLPKGSTVTLIRIEERDEQMEYLIVGHRSTTGRSLVELWVTERDLKYRLIV
jgi:hypothetical protein